MKMLLIALSVAYSLSNLTPVAHAGPISSGGVPGRILLQCSASSGPIQLRVLPMMFPGQGAKLVAIVASGVTARNQEFEVKESNSDPRGSKYLGRRISILIPEIQNPNRPTGSLSAILEASSVNHGQALILNCTR